MYVSDGVDSVPNSNTDTAETISFRGADGEEKVVSAVGISVVMAMKIGTNKSYIRYLLSTSRARTGRGKTELDTGLPQYTNQNLWQASHIIIP